MLSSKYPDFLNHFAGCQISVLINTYLCSLDLYENISNENEELSTIEAPRPRSDRTSQTSWSLNEDVPINDPELEAVFPRFDENLINDFNGFLN